MQKAHTDIQTATNGSKVIHEDGTVRDSMVSGETTLADHGDDDDGASTRGIVSPHSPRSGSLGVNGTGPSGALDTPPVGIPMIRVSSESDTELDDGETSVKEANGEAKVNGYDAGDDTSGLEKPAIAAAGEEDQDKEHASPQAPGGESFSFSNKRLCERWLDNLFMVLYEVNPFHDLGDSRIKWYFRTCECGLSSVPKLLISRRNMSHIVRLGWNGRSLANLD